MRCLAPYFDGTPILRWPRGDELDRPINVLTQATGYVFGFLIWAHVGCFLARVHIACMMRA
jgi:hypothetical protein